MARSWRSEPSNRLQQMAQKRKSTVTGLFIIQEWLIAVRDLDLLSSSVWPRQSTSLRLGNFNSLRICKHLTAGILLWRLFLSLWVFWCDLRCWRGFLRGGLFPGTAHSLFWKATHLDQMFAVSTAVVNELPSSGEEERFDPDWWWYQRRPMKKA